MDDHCQNWFWTEFILKWYDLCLNVFIIKISLGLQNQMLKVELNEWNLYKVRLSQHDSGDTKSNTKKDANLYIFASMDANLWCNERPTKKWNSRK